MHIQSI